jgi:anti-sigma factor RsiW
VIGCLEFRRRVGAEPAVDDAEVAEHRASCPACAAYQEELRAMDGLIRRALDVELPAASLPRAVAADAGAPRRRFLAIAASLFVGVAVGALLLVAAPRASVAREVMGHVTREVAESMKSTQPLSAAAVAGVLGPDGLRLRPSAGEVTFAARCTFDGRIVPHLVVRTPEGPVTVLVLRHRSLAKPVHFDEQGYAGVALPAPRGAIAVVGRDVADLDGVAKKVFEAVDFGA